ncbi:chaperone protein ClpB1-like [Hordeum vulgare subsp. vulgare]|uniref:chaperone protein ClpB1-like n=1 Tax=Hordeum vulgare subsp. vulgare TaxID=112509 RepID=UPI001D1A3E35|nr:chaperone protein ClpB1-like [Hordeum vulgare subsp. vulgare]
MASDGEAPTSAVLDRFLSHASRLYREVENVLCAGAAIGLCWAAWRYYERIVCLRSYGRDMTGSKQAVSPVVGRDREIDRVISILCRKTKNCAALVGAAGVGKTAIAEGLAQRIAAGKVPAALVGARVVDVDLGAMVAGTMFRGMFEERLKGVIKQAEDSGGKIVLFIDEMHMLLGAGAVRGGCQDAANMLKPALARGRIRCVGATTFDDYRKYIEKDSALERRFQKVHVEEPSAQATIAMLRALKQQYEQHHGLEIQDAALVAAVQLAGRYITGRQFPDKAIDLIDEACATAAKTMIGVGDQEENGNTVQCSSKNAVKEAIVCPNHVAQVVSEWTGIPVTALDQEEKERLIHLASRLRERVVGQDEAVNLVAQAVLRSRAGFDQPGQPIGSFLFLGSTGVGKTEIAKALAVQLFDSEKMLVRFDMSEYVDRGSVLRLIGAPPSYEGHEDGGQLTEKIRRRPYSVVLFDEVEKADPSVLNLFIQLLDDGVLTDGKGRTVHFKNTIIIMTSNLGAEHLTAGMAGKITMEAARDLVMHQVQKHFKPELRNRMSEIVIFEPLSREKLKEIVKIQMKSIVASVACKGISLSTSDAALDVVLSESYNPMYGARPVKRWLLKNVMTDLSEMLLSGQIGEGSSVSIDADNDKRLKFEVLKKVSDPQHKSPTVKLPVNCEPV